MENTNQSNPLIKIAEEIVARYGDIDPEVKNQLINDILVKIERYINSEIISRLSDEQAEEFVNYMQNNPSNEDMTNFLKTKGVDLQDAALTAIGKFKSAYNK